MKKWTVTDVAQWIQAKMVELTQESDKLKELIEKSANSNAEYDKVLAVTMMKLESEGKAKSLIEKYAKGSDKVANALVAKMVSDGMLKACYSNIERIKAQLNACQSLNKHLDVV
jgi:hypothetical protein